MKVYVAVLCVVLLQGVSANSMDTLDSIMRSLNSGYSSYRSGQLLSAARNYISTTRDALEQIQNVLNPPLPQLPSFSSLSSSLPSLASVRNALPSPPSSPTPPSPPSSLPQIPSQWPWASRSRS